jgi:type IV secretion system protein VirB10
MRIGGLPEIVALEGKFIDGVTVNQIETSFHDSPVTVLVTRDFIDGTGQYVLIPQGAKILGQAFRVVNQQQSRMFITFHRVIFPDGRSAYFPERQLPEGFNTAGLLGSDAKVNNHWFRKFGSAIVMGVVQGLAAAQAGDVKVDPFGGTTMSGSQFAVQSVSKQFEEVTRRMMDYYSNLAPTITVKPGSRMKIYLSEDMLFSAYGRPR